MSTYKHILFDLDHTLWDFDKNSAETLLELHTDYNLEKRHGIDAHHFITTYSDINARLWKLYDHGEITKHQLRKVRFEQVFQRFGAADDSLAATLDTVYIERCPEKTHLFEGTIELLELLVDKYNLHIVTNGFNETQDRKLKASGLHPYFDTVTTSENAGCKKPDPKYFYHKLKKINALETECIMIGDNLLNDVIGARGVSIDQVFFNHRNEIHQEKITHEIKTLKELRNILL